MSPELPEKGVWRVSDRHRADDAPFDLIKLNFRGRESGTVRSRNLETPLQRLRITGPDRFDAVYNIRGCRGLVEGTRRADGSLRLALSGSVTGTFVAREADPAAVEMPAAIEALAGAIDAIRRCGCAPGTFAL
jgi:hypothetical protein